MSIPANAFRWHEEGQILPGRIYYQAGEWFLAGSLPGSQGAVAVNLRLTGDGKGDLRAQPTGIRGAYVLADEYSWKPYIESIPGTHPGVGHRFSPGALYIGNTGPILWANAGSRIAALDILGNEVTSVESDSDYQPYFNSWQIVIHPTLHADQITKLVDITP